MASRKQFICLCLVLAIVGAVVVGIVSSPGAEDNSASVVYDSTGNSRISYQDETDGEPKQTDVALKPPPNSPPNRPSHASPANGATGISLAPVLQSSAFSDPDAEDTHAASQWQITSFSHIYFGAVFDSRRDSQNLTSITVPLGKLQAAKTYYWRVRHQDSHKVWSTWSAEASFTTIKGQPPNQPPARPTNVAPSDNTTAVSLTPTLQSKPFSDPEGDSHAASWWQVRTSSGNYSSAVFDSGTDTSNLVSRVIPSGKLDYSTIYYWRVRHQDNSGDWSLWSAETSFATAPKAPKAAFSAESTVQIVGQSVQFIDGSSGGITSWTWDFGDASTPVRWTVKPQDAKISHRYAAEGSYTVSLTLASAHGTSVESKAGYVNIYKSPQAGFSASATALSPGETVTFTNLSSGGIPLLSYAWDFDGDGTIDSTNPKPTFSYAVVGTYTVSLKMTDSRGNSDTETKPGHVTVSKAIEPPDITPQDLTAVTTTNGRIAVMLPTGAAIPGATVTFEQILPSFAEKAPEGFKMGSSCFTVEAADASGKAIFAFSRLVTINVKYSDEDLAAAGGAPENLVLAYYNEATGKWNIVETTLNMPERSLSVTTTHFSTWAVLAKTSPGGLASWIQIVIGVVASLVAGIVIWKSISLRESNQVP